ncbi:MAG: TlpA disulfide reductase family protein [Candidatus Methanomethylicaceae archaeon]|nr:TlpA disulfide reductase family protein [Candidatus Verstraetearchaeota archaeon]
MPSNIKNNVFILSIIAILLVIIGGWYFINSSKAPDFQLIDLNGKVFRLSDFRGKIVILDFMATWCSPCKQQIPYLIEVWQKYENEIVIISISIDPIRDSEEILRDFINRFPNATWIWARDIANISISYKVLAIPKIVIIDKDGNIAFEHLGTTHSSIIIQEIEKLRR